MKTAAMTAGSKTGTIDAGMMEIGSPATGANEER